MPQRRDPKYLSRVIERLVLLSDAKKMPESFYEWELHPNRPNRSSNRCELCASAALQQYREIRNKKAGWGLLICPLCFNNFWGPNAVLPEPVPVLDLDVD